MDPTVTAAAIGVTGTVIVGVAGFGAAIWNTRKTVLAAHRERVWDRKADAYQAAMTASLWRYHRRMYLTHTDLTEEQYAAAASELFTMQTQQEWWTMQGRLGTFGAPAAVEAYNKSLIANEMAERQHQEWRAARRDVDNNSRHPRSTVESVTHLTAAATFALHAFQAAMADAQNADYALEAALRGDLDRQPPPVPWRGILPPDPA